MSKVDLSEIGSLGNLTSAMQALNERFDTIELAFDNTLSRDGAVPNQMEADIDLNSNDLLNVKRIDADEIYKNGVPFEQFVAYANKKYQLLSGTGAQVDFVLTDDPASLGNLDVSISGVTQRPGLDYSITGNTLTFAVAPPSGVSNILVRMDRALPTGVTEASAVSFIAASVGAVLRTMQEKERDTISVHDSGAVGNGDFNEAAALTIANSAGALRFCAGKTYRIGTNMTLSSDMVFEQGAKLYIDTGVVVTLTGYIVAGLWQIFSGPGNVTGFTKNPTLYPEWFGADPTATIDSLTAVQTCLTAALDKEVLLSGFYKVSGMLTSPGPQTIRGLHKQNTGITTTSTTADILRLNVGTNIWTGWALDNFTLTATVTKTAGFAVNLLLADGGQVFDTRFSRLHITDKNFSGFNITGGIFTKFKDVDVVGVGQNGIGYRFRGISLATRVVNVFMEDCTVRTGVSGVTTIGILLDGYTEGFYVDRVTLENSLDFGLYIANGAGAPRPPENLWFTNLIADANVNTGIYIGDAYTARFNDCWATSAGEHGMEIAGGRDIELKGHCAINCGKYGVLIGAASRQVRVLGGLIDSNSQDASGTYSGIIVAANATDFMIKDVDFYREGTTKTHKYDVEIVAGTSDRYIVKNNRCRGYLTGAVQDGGSGVNKVVNENIT